MAAEARQDQGLRLHSPTAAGATQAHGLRLRSLGTGLLTPHWTKRPACQPE